MREFINIITEKDGNLGWAELNKRPGRWEIFTDKIKNKSPFKTVDGKEVIIRQDLWKEALKNKEFKLSDEEGNEIKIGKLAKTAEFKGGKASTDTAEATTSIEIKPADLGLCTNDKGFNLSSLMSHIKKKLIEGYADKDPQLLAAMDQFMKNAANGVSASVPNSSKYKAVIFKDAGEYLGLIAFLSGKWPAMKDKQLMQDYNIDPGALGSLRVLFPNAKNEQLIDSKIIAGDRMLLVSSKGGPSESKMGAAPSSTALLPIIYDQKNAALLQKMTKDKKKAEVLEVLTAVKETSGQEFPLWAMTHYWKALGFSNSGEALKAIEAIRQEDKNKDKKHGTNYILKNKSLQTILSLYSPINKDQAKSSDDKTRIRIRSAVMKAFSQAVHDGRILPMFSQVVLEILNVGDILQIDTLAKPDKSKDGFSLVYSIKYPATFHGTIEFDTATRYQSNSISGKCGFRLIKK